MSTKHLHAFIAFALGGLLMSCHSEIDINNIDPTVEVPVKAAIPVGSMSAKVADFFRTDDTAQFYIDTVGGQNVLTAQYTLADQTQSVEGYDFPKEISDAFFSVNLYNHLKDITFTVTIPYPTPHDTTVSILHNDSIIIPDTIQPISDSIQLDMPMNLPNLNAPDKDIRVDKATLPEANFDVVIDRRDFNDLKWDWVDEIYMVLGTQFNWTGHSNHVKLYKKGEDPDIDDFGQTIAMKLENLMLDFVKDHSADPSSYNVYNKLDANVIVKFTVPSGTAAGLTHQSGIDCTFKVKKVTVETLWGWFLSADGYSYRGVTDIDLSSLPFLETACLPIAAPQISAHLETPIAGNIKLTVDSLYTIDAAGNYQFANFNGSRKGVLKYTEADGCINPQTSALTDVADIQLGFDNTPAKGHIDSLFLKMPKKVGYNLNLNFDNETCNQVRIVANNLYATFGAHAKVPFSFNKGTKIDYTARLENVNIGKYQIDSLMKDVKGVDLDVNDVWLYLGFENGIPLNVFGTFRCLDDSGKVIMDPMDPNMPYTIIPDQDTIRLAGGTYEPGSKKVVSHPTAITCRVTQEHLNLFPKIKTIVYTFGVNDESLKDSQYGAEIKGSDNLKVQIGLTADINAVLNVLEITKKNNK